MIETKYENKILTAYLCGDIDQHSARNLRYEIDGQTEALRPQILRLDFKGVKFMDSSGIGLIMGRFKQISLLGGSLQVVNASDRVKKLLNISGVGSLGVLK